MSLVCKIKTLQDKVEMPRKCSSMPRLKKQSLGLDFLALNAYTTTALGLCLWCSYLQMLLIMCSLLGYRGDY